MNQDTLLTASVRYLLLLATALFSHAAPPLAQVKHRPRGPLKVFILAGQSNMEGHAALRTLDYIGKDPATAPLLKEMRGPDGKPRVCERVWISYLTGPFDGSANGEGLGQLTMGFGARGDEPARSGGKIGPEFTFGISVENGLKEPILIIKTAWGGKSLHTDFRPPSAGAYLLPKATQELWDRHPQGAHGIPSLGERRRWREEKDAATGRFYRMMIEHVKSVLADPARVCPVYDRKQGYELAGFVWFQGFNDLVASETYPGGDYSEYSRLLTHLIRDVRTDLSAPRLPFVIGVLGVEGEKHINFRQAMTAPTAMTEFSGNVAAVDTAEFWDVAIAEAEPRQAQYNEIVSTAYDLTAKGQPNREAQWSTFWKPIGSPPPEERIWRYTTVQAGSSSEVHSENSDRSFPDIDLPKKLVRWWSPNFSDQSWTKGKAPIGKGIWRHGDVSIGEFASKWDDKEFLLMRSTFEVREIDYSAFRLALLAKQGAHVYLNGQKIHSSTWSQDKPSYRSIILGDDEIRSLRKGRNVLCVYANHERSTESAGECGALDVWLEGIARVDQQALDRALENIYSSEDREAMTGASDGGYHYFGSAKAFAQIGNAFAKAVLDLQRQD